MATTAEGRTPLHLWIVGILATLWNGYGSTDYLMTRTRNTDWLSQGGADPQAMLAWVDSFPIWVQIGWAMGVWLGLLGSVLLLMRNRWAVWSLGLSLVGAVLSLGYQAIASPAPGAMGEGAFAVLPYVIILVAAALFLYARAQRRNGVLR